MLAIVLAKDQKQVSAKFSKHQFEMKLTIRQYLIFNIVKI